MKVLLLNQTFFPDVVSTAQHLTDLALGLKGQGHEVTVVTSCRGYDNPEKLFPAKETWRGIQIYRIASTRFGKKSKWRRAADFASFIVSCCWRLAFLPKQDAVVVLTSPPLISFIAAWFTRLRGGKFYYWIMDLNPDEAIAAGWLRRESMLGKILEQMSRFSFRSAEKVIALDRFMAERVAAKGISMDRIKVIPPWAHDTLVHFDEAGRERFRATHKLGDKFVVMYSGNHSPCHPLDTLLDAARRLDGKLHSLEQKGSAPVSPDTSSPPDPSPRLARRGEQAVATTGVQVNAQILRENFTPDVSAEKLCADRGLVGGQGLNTALEQLDGKEVVFCFVGGGSEFKRVQEFKERHGLKNILCLPYQPIEELSGSLSAADLHVVVMGEPFVGIVHPCKIYNILAVGALVLYIGPRPSHLTEILGQLPSEFLRIEAGHGEGEKIAGEIRKLMENPARFTRSGGEGLVARFSQAEVLPHFLVELV